MTEYAFEDLQVGDVIQTSRTLEVTHKHPHGVVELRDVRSRANFFQATGIGVALGTLRYEIVSKAEPPRYKPKVGDTVTGRDLFDREWPWPVGTVVKSHETGWTYIKHFDNNWQGAHCTLREAKHAGHATKYSILDISTRGNSNG